MKLTRVFGPTVNEYARADVQRPLRGRLRNRAGVISVGDVRPTVEQLLDSERTLTQALGMQSRTRVSFAPYSTYTAILSFIACAIVGDAKVPLGNSRISSLRNRLTSMGCTL